MAVTFENIQEGQELPVLQKKPGVTCLTFFTFTFSPLRTTPTISEFFQPSLRLNLM